MIKNSGKNLKNLLKNAADKLKNDIKKTVTHSFSSE